MHSKSMHPAMFLKVNLGVVRALENVKRKSTGMQQ